MFLASSLSEFEQQFEQHLIHMLASDSLGAFILVLANSMQDDRNLFVQSTENSHLPGFGLAYNSLGPMLRSIIYIFRAIFGIGSFRLKLHIGGIMVVM